MSNLPKLALANANRSGKTLDPFEWLFYDWGVMLGSDIMVIATQEEKAKLVN